MRFSLFIYGVLVATLFVAASSGSPHYEECFGRVAAVHVDTPALGRAILVLGNTGSGKTTLTQLIAGNTSGLSAREVVPGTGEYIIEDAADKISSTIESKTVVPERLVVNADTSLWDCPGFEDNRGSCVDIASAFLLRNVIGRAAAVKVVLVVNFPSVQVGMDRNDFVDVLHHTASTIRNVAKYADSLLLVVTKVPSEAVHREGQYVVLSDADVRRKIAAFLEHVKRELGRRPDELTSQEPQFREDATKILSVLLQRDGEGDYPRIGLLRRPDASGPIDGIGLMQQAKLDLRKMLERVGTFTTVDEADFGYALSAQSRHDVRLFVSQINEDMASSAQSVAADVVRLAAADEGGDDIGVLEEVKKIAVHLDTVISDLQGARDPASALALLQEACQSTGLVSATLAGAQRMQRAAAALSFLHEVAGRDLGQTPLQWLTPLRLAAQELQARSLWHDTLRELHERLTDYEVQRRADTFLEQCGVSGRNGVQSIEDMKSVISNLGITVAPSASSLVLVSNTDQRWIKMFNEVLLTALRSYALCPKHRSSSPTDHLRYQCTISGTFVRLSKLARASFLGCEKIYIWALDTIYFDDDLKLAGTQATVIIVAPRWVVVDRREIDLDGANGRDGQQVSVWEHLQSLMPGSTGIDGYPGEHGGPSGQLLGVGMEFVNASNLWVHGRGGSGGSGRDGMDGTSSGWLPFLSGGRGGDGGAAGLGGEAGRVAIFGSGGSRDTGIGVTVGEGRRGQDGRGGRGGYGAHGIAPPGAAGVNRKGRGRLVPGYCDSVDVNAELDEYRTCGSETVRSIHSLARDRFMSMDKEIHTGKWMGGDLGVLPTICLSYSYESI